MHSIFKLSVIVGILLSSLSAHAQPATVSKGRNFIMDLERRPANIGKRQEGFGGLAAENTGEIDLHSIDVDVQYVGTVSVGTPPIEFKMVLDTGSSDVWFPSIGCSSCSKHPRLDPKKSSTYQSLHRQWSLQYFDRTYVGGVVGKDTIRIGGLEHANQTIGLATTESEYFRDDTQLDGMFGLAFPPLSMTRQKSTTVLDMYNAGEIDEPVFGIYMDKTENGGKGEAIFGGVNQDRFTGDLEYIKLTKKTYWQVHFDGVEINGKLHTDRYTNQAMVDTGTTLLDLPSSITNTIHHTIPHGKLVKNRWVYPCNTTTDSTVTIKLGGKGFPIKLSDLIRDRYLKEDPSYCVSGVGISKPGLAIIGQTFLRTYYSAYNFKDATVGFAPSG